MGAAERTVNARTIGTEGKLTRRRQVFPAVDVGISFPTMGLRIHSIGGPLSAYVALTCFPPGQGGKAGMGSIYKIP